MTVFARLTATWLEMAAPERRIVQLAGLSLKWKVAVMLAFEAVFWMTGSVVNAAGVTPWRLLGFILPMLAVLLWGGPAGFAAFAVNYAGVHRLLALRHLPILGGWAVPILAALILSIFGLLRHYVLKVDKAQQEIHSLQGILPICSGCKKIRNDQGYWDQVERYISARADVHFSHSFCPDCLAAELRKFA